MIGIKPPFAFVSSLFYKLEQCILGYDHPRACVVNSNPYLYLISVSLLCSLHHVRPQFMHSFTPLFSHVFSAVILSPPASSLSTRVHPFVVYSSALSCPNPSQSNKSHCLFRFSSPLFFLFFPFSLPGVSFPLALLFLPPTQFMPN